MRNTLVAAIALVAVGTVAALSLVSRPVVEPAKAPPSSPAPSPAPGTQSPPPASSQLPAAEPAAKPPVAKTGPGRMLFPDGSQAVALNGVTADVKLIWGDQPFSPIKTKVVDRGLEWYVHEDGTYSTVMMRDVRGTMMPFGMVGRPSAELAPMHDEAQLQKEREQQQKAANGH